MQRGERVTAVHARHRLRRPARHAGRDQLRACCARTTREVLTVDDAATVAAMRLFWQRTKQLVEPSSAVALAAVLGHRERFAGLRVGVVLSGGNVDPDALPELFARA